MTNEEIVQHLAVGFTKIPAGLNQMQSPHRLHLGQTSSCKVLGKDYYPALLVLKHIFSCSCLPFIGIKQVNILASAGCSSCKPGRLYRQSYIHHCVLYNRTTFEIQDSTSCARSSPGSLHRTPWHNISVIFHSPSSQALKSQILRS